MGIWFVWLKCKAREARRDDEEESLTSNFASIFKSEPLIGSLAYACNNEPARGEIFVA